MIANLAMDSLLQEHEKLCKRGTLSKSIDDVQKTIDLLVKARDSIASGLSPLCSYSFHVACSNIY